MGECDVRSKPLLAAAMFIGAIPGTAGAQAGRAGDLQVIANFFLPSPMYRQMIQSGCTTKYRAKLAANAGDQTLERKMPGVHAKMLAAAAAYCNTETPTMIRRRQDRIRSDWRSLNPADLSRLARLYGPAAAEAMRASGDSGGASQQQVARLNAAQIAFSKTPGGTALINRVTAYQRQVQPAVQDDALAVIKGGLAASHRTANAYAKQKGFAAPYPNG
jgi:hypothetical protein